MVPLSSTGALADLRMAMKLRDGDIDNAQKTLEHMRDIYRNDMCTKTSPSIPEVSLAMLDAAYAKEPGNQALLMACVGTLRLT